MKAAVVRLARSAAVVARSAAVVARSAVVVARSAVVVMLAAGISVGFAASASAHDVLISSSPKEGTTLSAAPSSVTFTFDQPVQNFDPVVSLIGPDGKQYATGVPVIRGNVVTDAVGSGPAGAYIVAYRIVSADGHPVTGEVHFTLAAGAGRPSAGVRSSGPGSAAGGQSGTAAGAPPGSAGAQPGSTGGAQPGSTVGSRPGSSAGVPRSGNSTGLSGGLWAGLILAALIVAAAAVVLFRRPSPQRTGDKDY